MTASQSLSDTAALPSIALNIPDLRYTPVIGHVVKAEERFCLSHCDTPYSSEETYFSYAPFDRLRFETVAPIAFIQYDYAAHPAKFEMSVEQPCKIKILQLSRR